jgi:hypothetical protein
MSNLKEVIESDNWIVTKIIENRTSFRVDAKRRFPVADKSSFFSNWGGKKYIDSLCRENYGKKASELKSFSY